MNKGHRILKIFLSSPQTWLVLVLSPWMAWAFIQWFQPSLTMGMAAWGMSLLLVLIWPIVFIRSDVFSRKYNQIPDAIRMEELEKLLGLCLPSFKKPAQECLALAHKIREEFKDETFLGQVDDLLQNLGELARNHSELLERSQKFGTEKQRLTMLRLLEDQTRSVEGSLTALKGFSGNLTLFDLHAKDQKEIDRELKDINLGLQEAIKEVQHD
jgi:hypothetical protein